MAKSYRETRRIEAETRAEAHKELSPKDQLKALDKRLGKGVGATKERAKLEKQIKGKE